jgi:outer membrane protein assembly factor BamB
MKRAGDGYYIVVSRWRNTTCCVGLALLASLASPASGQQPNKKPAPWIAPLLPAEPAWEITLPAEPAAAGAMDFDRVYIPLEDPVVRPEDVPVLPARSLTVPALGSTPLMVPSFALEPPAAMIVALERETGRREWLLRVASTLPPVVGDGVVYVAAGREILAVDAARGARRWAFTLDRPPRMPLLLQGDHLLALTEANDLVAVNVATRAEAWRRPLTETGAVRMRADDRAVYLASAAGTLTRVRLADGAIDWAVEPERGLAATSRELSEPAIARDRVLVGSTSQSFLAIDPESGATRWHWTYRHIGGDVIGAAVVEDVIYAAALDNTLRAVNRSDGNQKWKRDLSTRPLFPPQTLPEIIIVTGLSPLLSTFNARTGAPIGSWAAPANAEPEGRPLIDPSLRPFRTAIVVILRDGRVIALRPTAMLFKELPVAPFTVLPGRPLTREPAPGASPLP